MKRRNIIIGVIVVLLIGTGIGTAITVLTVGPDRITLFTAGTADSNFDLTTQDTKVKGKDKVTVDLTLTNTDSAAHEANVTVQLLDSNDDVIVETHRLTGSVAGGGTWSDKFDFQQANLASDYDESVIIVNDVS